MVLRIYLAGGGFKSLPPSRDGVPYPDYLKKENPNVMDKKISPERAQMFCMEHIRNAIDSLALAQEYSVTGSISSSFNVDLAIIRKELGLFHHVCGSEVGRTHFKLVADVIDSNPSLNKKSAL